MIKPGQTVVVSAAPYRRWVSEQIQKFSRTIDAKGKSSQSWACRHWLEGSKGKPPYDPNKFPWHLILLSSRSGLQVSQFPQKGAVILCRSIV